MAAASTSGALEQVLRQGQVRCAYQPVVDLDTREVVAHEALMRGPAGTPLESPLALLDSAQTDDQLAELDHLAHTVALTAVSSHANGRGQALFLNVEPRGIGASPASDIATAWARAREVALEARLDVVIELTERALLDDPAGVLQAVDRMRELGARIALDDVGATPESLAFLPLIRPDVVKLDLRLVREHGAQDTAEISNAVRAYAEESGADVVAEGVEDAGDHEIALSLGATLGQGWLYGRPGALPDELPRGRPVRVVPPLQVRAGATPYAVVHGAREVRCGTKAVLLPVSRSLERAAVDLAIPPLLLGCFQDERYFSPATASRYQDLGQRLPLVAALGTRMPPAPAPGVRGAALTPGDPLAGEWNVIVVGAHYAAALVALDLGDTDRPEQARRFDYVVTHDRALVLSAAQTLLGRLVSARPT